jgi:aspartate aminotransferase
MTGFRLGYLIANRPLINQMIKFNQITITCVPEFIQQAGLMVLEKEKKFSQKLTSIYQKRARLAKKILKPTKIKFAPPQAGFYIFCQLPNQINAEKFALTLLDKGVALVPGTSFGSFPNFVRLSLTVSEKELIKALNIIKNEVQN